MAVGEAGEATQHKRLAVVILVMACLVQTSRQVAVWRDSGTLFRHALAQGYESDVAHFNLALYLAGKREDKEAIAHYRAELKAAGRAQGALGEK